MIVEEMKRNKLYLSNGEILDISPFIREKYQLKIAGDIAEFYDELVYDAALEKGIFLLYLRDRTKKEITAKLKEKYRNFKKVYEVVERLEELGYIDDLNYAMNFIRAKKYGKQRLAYSLKLKGIDEETINLAYERISEELDFSDIDEEKLEKAIIKNIKKDRRKLIQYLLRQGFSYNKISSKLYEYDENN